MKYALPKNLARRYPKLRRFWDDRGMQLLAVLVPVLLVQAVSCNLSPSRKSAAKAERSAIDAPRANPHALTALKQRLAARRSETQVERQTGRENDAVARREDDLRIQPPPVPPEVIEQARVQQQRDEVVRWRRQQWLNIRDGKNGGATTSWQTGSRDTSGVQPKYERPHLELSATPTPYPYQAYPRSRQESRRRQGFNF